MPNEPDFEPFDDFGIRWLSDAEFMSFFKKVTPEQFDDFFLPPDDEPPPPEV